MKPYPKYKDSEVEWIGKVPDGWEVKRIKYSFRLITEKNCSLQMKKVALENIESWTGRFIDSEGDYQGEGILFRKGDVLFGKLRPYLAKVLNAKFSGASVGDIFVMRPEFGISSRFAFYRFLSKPFIDIVDGSTFGAKMPRVSWNFIANLPIAVPGNDEQTAIATYLDHKITQIDNLISKKQKLIELIKEERAAIINQAVTKGLNPDAPMKDSGIEWLGEIPKNWEVKRLKFLVNKVGSGVTPRGGASVYQKDGIPLLRSQNIYFEGLKLDDVAYISEEIHNEMSGSKVKPNDVLLNITGASIGRCCIVPSDFGEANVNQHVCIIRSNRQIESGFLHNYISSNNGQAQIFSSEKGISREGLNFEQLKGFQVLLPPIGDQKDIKDYIESAATKIDQTISKIEKQTGLLREFRTALISEVVTGKIDVRDEELE